MHISARAHIHTPIIRALLPRSRLKWLRREPIYYYYKLYIQSHLFCQKAVTRIAGTSAGEGMTFSSSHPFSLFFHFLLFLPIVFRWNRLRAFRLQFLCTILTIKQRRGSLTRRQFMIKTVIPTNLISLVLLSPAVRRCKYLDSKGHIRSACSVLVYEYR